MQPFVHIEQLQCGLYVTIMFSMYINSSTAVYCKLVQRGPVCARISKDINSTHNIRAAVRPVLLALTLAHCQSRLRTERC
jgi:hypothetical protein